MQEELFSLLKTGDLLFCSGTSFFSNLIKLTTHSQWSHVGMIYRNLEGGLFCWEANKIEKGVENIKCGVEVYPLKEKILNYKGDIAVRRIENSNLDQEKATAIIAGFIEEVKCFPYETNVLELLKSVADGPFGLNVRDLSSIFCSELVAEAYQRLGLLLPSPAGLSSNEYTPADFARKNFRLLSGHLSPLIILSPHLRDKWFNEKETGTEYIVAEQFQPTDP